MSARKWRCKKEWFKKRHSRVWIVEDKDGNTGYFKIATKVSGPMIANEFVASYLAASLGFQVPEIELATVKGPGGVVRTGIVSARLPVSEVVKWNRADKTVHKSPAQHVNNMELLLQLCVFDCWILNTDRAGRNLILYRNATDEKYNWYVIDHGHSLCGPSYRWKHNTLNHPKWQEIWRFATFPAGLLSLPINGDTLAPMIDKIEGLSPAMINDALNSVPPHYLSEKDGRFMKRLLLTRQQQLRQIIAKWLEHQGWDVASLWDAYF